MSDPTDPTADRPAGDPDLTGSAPPPPPPPPGDPYGQQYGQPQYGQPQYDQPQYGQPQYEGQYQQPYGAGPPTQGNGAAVAGLVLGILGVILAFVPLFGVVAGIVLGVLAGIFGGVGASRARDPYRGGRGMGIAGIVLGIIAVVLSLLQGVFLGALTSEFVGDNPEIIEELEQLEQDLQTP